MSSSADSAITFAAAMPAIGMTIGGASGSSARREETNTSQSLITTDTSSSESGGGRGRDQRARNSGTPARVDEVEEEGPQGSRSRSPSRPSTSATEIQLASARASPRGLSPRTMTPVRRQTGASRLLPSPVVGVPRANPRIPALLTTHWIF